MEDYHWSYLNSNYHQDVIARWGSDGCLDEIKRRLGYRLSLTDVYHTTTVYAGGKMNVRFTIKNSGFAAPMNGRGVELVLVDSQDSKTVIDLSDEVDPRYWFAGGKYTVETSIDIPESETDESYTLYLNLPDPKATLHDNPYFSIRLANNENIWDATTGYNKLFTVNIEPQPEPEPEPDPTPDPEPEPTPDPDTTTGSASGEDATIGSEYNPW
jgi:hypothetical protein